MIQVYSPINHTRCAFKITNSAVWRAVQCSWSSRWGALIQDSNYEDGAINPSDFLIPLCGFFPLCDSEWLIATSLNCSGEAACLCVMLVLLLFLSEGEWWACTCLAYPQSGCRDRQWCGAAVPSQEIGLDQPWHWGAVGRDAAFVVGLLVLREPKVLLVFLGFFYCVLLCFLWMLSFGKQECSEKNIWSCWVRRKPYQQLIWMGIAVVDGRSRLWYVMSNSCLSSILLSECFLTIFFSMENLGVVLSFLLVISQFS